MERPETTYTPLWVKKKSVLTSSIGGSWKTYWAQKAMANIVEDPDLGVLTVESAAEGACVKCGKEGSLCDVCSKCLCYWHSAHCSQCSSMICPSSVTATCATIHFKKCAKKPVPKKETEKIGLPGWSPDPGLASQTWQMLWGINQTLPLASKAADFYVLQRLKALCSLGHLPDTDAEKALNFVDAHLPGLITELAGQMSNYLEMAIGGELRHLRAQTKKFKHEYHEEVMSVFKRGILSQDMGRYSAWKNWGIWSREVGIKAAKLCQWSYHNHSWQKGFGGLKWAKCADVLVAYRECELTPEMFVDMAFGLEHNANNVFDKVWSLELVNLKKVLDQNLKDNVSWLLTKASQEIATQYKILTMSLEVATPSYSSKTKTPTVGLVKEVDGKLAYVLSPSNVCLVCNPYVTKPCSKIHAVFKPVSGSWHCYQCHKGSPIQVVLLSQDGYTKHFALCSFCLLNVPKPFLKVAGHVLPV